MTKWVIFFFSLIATSTFAQRNFESRSANENITQLNWYTRTIASPSQNEAKDILFFDGADYDSDAELPFYYEYIQFPQFGNLKVTLENEKYELLEEINLIRNKDFIKENIEIKTSTGIERKKPVGSISFIPIRYNSSLGRYEKLVSFSLKTEVIPISRKLAANNYAANSVLASGNWYKIAVTQDGIYKLSYTFLKDLGIDVDNINPKNIRLFGNGGGMLPEPNGEFRHDDLAENAIYVEGENDGKFNANDYILFYGQSPDQWKVSSDGKSFYFEKHLYDTRTYYFITTDLGTGKRISTQSSSGTANYTVTTFDDHAVHEAEEINFIKSGREWYGEEFNYNSTPLTFNFGFPSIVADSLTNVRTVVAARTLSSPSSFKITTGGISNNYSIAKGGSTYDGIFANEAVSIISFKTSSSSIPVTVEYLPPAGEPDAKGWLNYIEVNAKRYLNYLGNQMSFRSLASVAPGRTSEFKINTGQNISVWEITDPTDVKNQSLNKSGNSYSFNLPTESLREFIAFSYAGNFLSAEKVGTVANQNIHGTIGQPDLVIVTPDIFKSQAQQLALMHQNSGLDVSIVLMEQIYNEFASGSKDITAIRDMMKMLYDRANIPDELPQYLLLFGDASYDYKNIEQDPAINTDFVPTYQSYQSLHSASTYCSDDYFGLLDENEGHNIITSNQKLDVAIGRLPVQSTAEATAVVNKIMHYKSQSSFGNWRNIVTFLGDDAEDSMSWMIGSDNLSKYVDKNHPVYNVDKIYLDAFKQVSTPGGNRYPEATKALNNRIYSGTLVLNYIGHGGEAGWAHERVLGMSDINNWENIDKLPLFTTATCSFTRFDNPNRKSAGEVSLVKADGGTIALISTVRLVFFDPNMSDKLFEYIFKPLPNGDMPTLGEVSVYTKNNISGGDNNRKFLLFGDPALHLAYPKENVRSTEVKSTPVVMAGDTITNDTLKALAKVTISGEVLDKNGGKITTFNGIVYPTIYDKPVTVTTLANDPKATPMDFSLQKNIIYKGKASVNNGEFTYTFVVPKDIAYNIGAGKISYYASNDAIDAHGYDRIMIGGSADSAAADNQGPKVELFMNDEKFVFGGLTDENPLLIVKLFDENGINTAGSAIGHDISGLLDDDTQGSFSMNDFYEAELDNYQKGEVRYPLSDLEQGRHTIKVKAWDVYNNSGDGYTEFVVASSADLALSHVLNYPNPFTSNTSFWFEHNRPGELLNVQVQIFTVSGKLVKTLHQDILSEGYRVDNISWNGRDEFGDQIGKGVYVYKVNVRAQDGAKAHKFEKLVILQ